jgi:hypothetical protein
MISPCIRNQMVAIVVLNSKYRQSVGVEKSKKLSSVANGSHPSIDHGGREAADHGYCHVGRRPVRANGGQRTGPENPSPRRTTA